MAGKGRKAFPPPSISKPPPLKSTSSKTAGTSKGKGDGSTKPKRGSKKLQLDSDIASSPTKSTRKADPPVAFSKDNLTSSLGETDFIYFVKAVSGNQYSSPPDESMKKIVISKGEMTPPSKKRPPPEEEALPAPLPKKVTTHKEDFCAAASSNYNYNYNEEISLLRKALSSCELKLGETKKKYEALSSEKDDLNSRVSSLEAQMAYKDSPKELDEDDLEIGSLIQSWFVLGCKLEALRGRPKTVKVVQLSPEDESRLKQETISEYKRSGMFEVDYKEAIVSAKKEALKSCESKLRESESKCEALSSEKDYLNTKLSSLEARTASYIKWCETMQPSSKEINPKDLLRDLEDDLAPLIQSRPVLGSKLEALRLSLEDASRLKQEAISEYKRSSEVHNLVRMMELSCRACTWEKKIDELKDDISKKSELIDRHAVDLTKEQSLVKSLQKSLQESQSKVKSLKEQPKEADRFKADLERQIIEQFPDVDLCEIPSCLRVYFEFVNHVMAALESEEEEDEGNNNNDPDAAV